MSHCVTAIIARTSVVKSIMERQSNLSAIDLRDDFRLIPLDDDDLDSLVSDFSTTIEGFSYLSPALMSFLSVQSEEGSLVYVETEYFGGLGNQSAAAFSNGAPILTLSGDGAINAALRSINITAHPGRDEFDFIGLSRHRLTSDWKEAANP